MNARIKILNRRTMTQPEEKRSRDHADAGATSAGVMQERRSSPRSRPEWLPPTLPPETPHEKITQELAPETNTQVQHVAAPSETQPEIPDAV